ncbi:MAG: DnaJ domain-containing protein [Candidatus Zhuqueibacterota bacterium]
MKDYYVILGLPRNCNLAEIKKAYRNLAKQHHPDKIKGDNCSGFREVQEAYETLSENDKRRDYDSQLRKSESSRPIAHRAPSVAPQSFTDCPFSRFDYFSQTLQALHHPDFYSMELILTPSEAKSGGAVPLNIPTHETCNECRGFGFIGFRACHMCRGAGVINRAHQVVLKYPSDAMHNEQFETFIQGFGYLHITVKIYEH